MLQYACHILLILTTFMSFNVMAAPPVAARLPRLVSAADLIVVGRFVSLEAHLNSSRAEVIFTISPDRVLKGNLPAGGGAIVASARVGEGPPPEAYGVFFLKQTETGQYTEAVPDFSSIFALQGADLSAHPADPLTAVAQEQIAVLRMSASILAEIPGMSASVPPLTQTQRAEARYIDASEQIGSLPVAVARPLLEGALSNNSDIMSESWITITLMDIGVPVSFDSINSFLSNPPPDAEWTRTALVSRIGSYGGTYSMPPEAAGSLAGLLGASDVEVRRAAAHGLRSFKNEISKQALAKTALNDPDREVRIYAETGLCWAMAVRSSPCDTAAEQNEEALRLYWTNWTRSTYR